jgi:hypothetical protein
MLNSERRADIAPRGNCRPMPNARANSWFRSLPSVAQKEQKQPICRNDEPILSEWPSGGFR